MHLVNMQKPFVIDVAFEYKLSELKEEWNGLKTCPECFEPKHPQLEPLPHVIDPRGFIQT